MEIYEKTFEARLILLSGTHISKGPRTFSWLTEPSDCIYEAAVIKFVMYHFQEFHFIFRKSSILSAVKM